MKKYSFSGDSGIRTLEASTPDEAARKYNPRVKTMAQLVADIDDCGGYITIEEDGVVIERISAN